MKTTALRLKVVYSFINFIIPLAATTYVRHSWESETKEFAEVNIENC